MRTSDNVEVTSNENEAEMLKCLNPFRTAVPFWGQTSLIYKQVVPETGLRPYKGQALRDENLKDGSKKGTARMDY